MAGSVSAAGCTSSLAFGSLSVQFPGPANVLALRLVMKYFLRPLTYVGQLSVTGEKMCIEYWLTTEVKSAKVKHG